MADSLLKMFLSSKVCCVKDYKNTNTCSPTIFVRLQVFSLLLYFILLKAAFSAPDILAKNRARAVLRGGRSRRHAW